MPKAPATRPYMLKRRAQAQAQTRQRIVEAIVALHEEVGPAATTVSAIAGRAGVERLTVYRHFPDERAQLLACSTHWQQLHPAPDPAAWIAIRQPRRRLRAALEAFHDYYEAGQPMLEKILRDAPLVPALREVLQPFEGYLAEVARSLASGWNASDPRLLEAAMAHALQFETWRSLSRRLQRQEGVELLVRFVAAAAR